MNNTRNEFGKFEKSAIYVDKICLYCKKSFNTKKLKKIYCSRKCYQNHRMEKSLLECIICGKQTKNKKYCSEKCQYVGYKHNGQKVEIKCLFCNKMFNVRKCRSFRIYCSKKCGDEHRKELRKGKNNGMYGKKYTDEKKKIISNRSKDLWKSEEFRKKISVSIENFVKIHGYSPGCDCESIRKRKETCIKKYGVDHIWKSEEIRKKCDDTCFRLYGKSALEILRDAEIYGYNTSIEKIIQNILKKHNIEFITRFKIPYEKTYKEYDIYIPSLKLLIEADGDFWHANPKIFNKSELYEIQEKNIENDLLKDNLAKSENLILIRYWENDIIEKKFEDEFIKDLKKYGYDKN